MRALRTAVAALLIVMVACAALVSTPRTAHACTCMRLPLSEYADEVDVAFQGRQIERIPLEPDSDELDSDEFLLPGEGPFTLVFEVDRVYKGVVGSRIEVYTWLGGASCGVSFDGRGVVGVAASARGGKLRVDVCSSPVSIGDLEEVFGDGVAPDPPVDEVSSLEEKKSEVEEVFGDGVAPDPPVDEVSSLEEEMSGLNEEVTDPGKGFSNIERILQSAVTILILLGLAVGVVKLRRKPG